MASRIETVREKASESLEVAVSGGLVFFFDDVDAKLLDIGIDRGGRAEGENDSPVLPLWPNAELSDEDVELLGQLDALKRARSYAMQIVARAEQGSRQMYEKLVHKGYAVEISRACVAWMCDAAYIDDARYVKMLFQVHCVKRGQGLARAQQLAWQRIGLFESQKRILAEAFGRIEEEEMTAAVTKCASQMLRRDAAKHRIGSETDAARDDSVRKTPHGDVRSQLRAYLKRQGFPGYAIESYLESWENDENEK